MKELRQLIEHQWSNYVRNVMSPDQNDRKGIESMTLKSADGDDELSSHLQDAERIEDDADIWGPVPPKKDELTFAPLLDPYSNDWSVLPRRNGR